MSFLDELIAQSANLPAKTIEEVGPDAAEAFAVGALAHGWKWLSKIRFIKGVTRMFTGTKRSADFDKINGEILDELADHGAQADRLMHKVWAQVTFNALDPAFTSPEIRHEDLDRLAILNGTDILMIILIGNQMQEEDPLGLKKRHLNPVIPPDFYWHRAEPFLRQVFDIRKLIDYAREFFDGQDVFYSNEDLLYVITSRSHFDSIVEVPAGSLFKVIRKWYVTERLNTPDKETRKTYKDILNEYTKYQERDWDYLWHLELPLHTDRLYQMMKNRNILETQE